MPKGLAGFPKAAPTLGRQSRPFVAGTWMSPCINGTNNSTTTSSSMSTTRVMCTPLLFDVPILIDGWYTKVATLQAASTVEVAIYSVAPGGRPNQLITRLGLVDSTSTGDKEVAMNPTYIPAGDAVACFLTNVNNVAMTSYTGTHYGVRLTDPATFAGFAVNGLEFTVGFTALPQRFTGAEVPAASATTAGMLCLKINKVLA